MSILAEIRDKERRVIAISSYDPIFESEVVKLFEEGLPDSFDKYDLEFIEEFLETMEEGGHQHCFLATMAGDLVGASLIEKVAGPQDQWETSYIFARETLRGRGIGRILVGVQEEYLKRDARISFAINPGILPDDVISYPFWRAVGYELWGILPGYFRDDLSGIFLVKRNPNYRVGRGIPQDSGWELRMADSLTGKRISKEEYREILFSLKKAPKEKWGLGLIGTDSVVSWNL